MQLGLGELIVIFLVLVILFGPNKIPQIARDLGQGVRKMKGALEEIKTEIMKEADNPISAIKKEVDQIKQTASEVNPLSDVQKQVDEMKQAFNPMTEQLHHLPGDANGDALAQNDTKKEGKEDPQQVDQLSEGYSGPVSR